MSGIEGTKRPRNIIKRLEKWAGFTRGKSPYDGPEEAALKTAEFTPPRVERERPRNATHSMVQRTTPPPVPQTTHQKWSERSVEMASINMRNLPIDWDALTHLGKSLNRLADNRVSRENLAHLKPPADTYIGIPMVASVIAHQRNREIPIQLPSKEDVGKIRWYVNELYEYIGFFSERLAERFRRYVEREGERVVLKTGLKVADVADLVGSIENPREQMLKEIKQLYQFLQKPEVEEGIFWNDAVPIENKIQNFLLALKDAKHDASVFTESTYQNYPILLRLLPKLNLPSDGFDTWSASVAGAELIQGLEHFLRQKGIVDIGAAPQPQEFDFFDLTSWPRAFAEMFAGEKLERVKYELPAILEQALAILPANGPQFANQLYDIAENICVLHAQGKTPSDLAHHIFVKGR